MNLSNSLLWDLVTEYPQLRPQTYFKSSLTALARAMQDLVLADNEEYLVIANFQQENYFRNLERRFLKMATSSEHVYILGVPAQESRFALDNGGFETVPLAATDTLAGERYLVIVGQQYSACLAVREKIGTSESRETSVISETSTRYEGVWTFDRGISYSAADWLLGMIANLRPELKIKTIQARRLFVTKRPSRAYSSLTTQSIDLGIFTQSLVTYLQASQYKLVKAYQAIAAAEQKEYLSNRIAAAQRSSLDPTEIIATTVTELGNVFPHCRCMLYQLNPEQRSVKIEYEYHPKSMTSLQGENWFTVDNPLFISAQAQKFTLVIEDVSKNPYLQENPLLKHKIERAGIESWMIVPIRYQDVLLGMVELHYGGKAKIKWKPEDISLVEAISNSAGAALTQASAYSNLLDLNAQLAAVERIQSNLIAIVGHELRTPVSTIRVCLESLATEPEIPLELKNSMLDTALEDTERLNQLIQNFITLSKLEAGKAYRNIESLTIDYAVDLALRKIKAKAKPKQLPEIIVRITPQLPAILADVDGLVEVFWKLIDNACKFTPAPGIVTISAHIKADAPEMLEIIIADTGRGLSSEQIEVIFDRFAQTEGYLRRTVSGAGLGLVISRQIINSMGGEIWATSEGENCGSQFHFTLNIDKLEKL